MAQSTLFDRDIDRSSPQPFYLQLSDAIEAAIDSGLFTPGERLPSESELCRKFDLARSTVRETLRTLEDRRRIRVVPRRGAFVIDPWQAGWGLQVATGFFEGEVDDRSNIFACPEIRIERHLQGAQHEGHLHIVPPVALQECQHLGDDGFLISLGWVGNDIWPAVQNPFLRRSQAGQFG